MTTATRPPATTRRVAGPAVADRSIAREFLRRYTTTLLPIAGALVALQLGAQELTGGADALGRGWPLTIAVTGGWTLAVVAWLRRRGWAAGSLAAVATGPAAVAVVATATGWLAPAGLLLWEPVSTLLAVALVSAAQPLPIAAPTHEGPGQRTDQGLHGWGE